MKTQLVKGEIPFVRLFLPLATGIAAGICLGNLPVVFMFSKVLPGLSLFLFFVYVLCYKRLNLYRHRWIGGCLLHLLIMSIGLFITVQKSGFHDPDHFSKRKADVLFIRVSSEPAVKNGIERFTAIVIGGYAGKEPIRLTGNILVASKVDSFSKVHRYGDEMLIPSRFNEIDPPFNPNEFDYKNYLANQQIYQQTFFSESQIQILKINRGNPIVNFAINSRKKMVQKFRRYIHDPDAFAVASTLILGYRSDLSRDVLDIYSKTGTMHVLSVSGMHVGIVYIVLAFLLRFMDRKKLFRIIRAILIILLIWAYAILTGFSPSVCRSALMLSFLVLGKTLNRKSNSYNIVAASAVLLLIYNPYFLVDVGFQLSYLAVLGLIYFYPKIYHLLYVKNRLADEIWKAVSLSAAAQLTTFPLSVFYFHQFPVYFLLSNLFILIPVALIMYIGLAVAIVPGDIILKPLAWLLERLIIITNKGLYMIEHIPGANYEKLWIPAWYYLLMYLFITFFILSVRYRNKRLLYGAWTILFVFCAYHAYSGIKRAGQREIIFYSLRKNAAFAQINGGTAKVVSDLPPGDKTFSFSVQPSLDARVSSFELSGFQKNYTMINGANILIWDKSFNNKVFFSKLNADLVLIHNNPSTTLSNIKQLVSFKYMLIDGTNPDYKIENWKKEAGNLKIPLRVLKGNEAFKISY